MQEKTVVAVDAMGGDNAPGEIVRGALDAIGRRGDIKVILVGKSEAIQKELAGASYPKDQLEIVEASEVIETAEPPVIQEIRVPAARYKNRFPAVKLPIRAFRPGNNRPLPLPDPVVIVVEPEFRRRLLFKRPSFNRVPEEWQEPQFVNQIDDILHSFNFSVSVHRA